jgi:16S rRNA (cytidine1402-2'-O)-methyltransferase
MPGTLFLVPNALDLGAGAGAAPAITDVLPLGTLRIAARLRHWIAESAKTTRAFLKRVDEVAPLGAPLQAISIVELPRPPKGGGAAPEMAPLLGPARAGHDVGLISEAGFPAVADPGAALVAAAHRDGIAVRPLAGPSALPMALAASGLDGQSFAFVGYVPSEPAPRAARLRELEQRSRRLAQTQILIETPYRNRALLEALLAHLQPATRLAVSVGLTLASEFTRSDPVERWRTAPSSLPNDVPAVFSLLA